MNWLIYIGGSSIILNISIWVILSFFYFYGVEWETAIWQVKFVLYETVYSILAIWIWICWRFISEEHKKGGK